MGEKTRKKILEASLQLFASQGYHKTSITQIVKSAQTYRAAIEWHFGNKEGLLLAVLDYYLEDQLLKQLRERWDQFLKNSNTIPREQTVNLFFRELTDLVRNNQGIILALFILTFERMHTNPRIGHRIKQAWDQVNQTFKWMVEARREGKVTKYPLDAETLARIVVAQGQGTFVQWYLEPDPENAQKVFAQLLQAFRLIFANSQGQSQNPD